MNTDPRERERDALNRLYIIKAGIDDILRKHVPAPGRKGGGMKKLISVLVSFAIFYWISIHTHEAGHYLIAAFLDQPGSVTYTWLGGRFNYDSAWALQFYNDSTQSFDVPFRWLMALSGGLLVAILYGVFALVAWWQSDSCPWELDDLAALAIIANIQLAYGITEALGVNTLWGSMIAALATVPLLIYMTNRVVNWILPPVRSKR